VIFGNQAQALVAPLPLEGRGWGGGAACAEVDVREDAPQFVPRPTSNIFPTGTSRAATVPCRNTRTSSTAPDPRGELWSNSRLPSENTIWLAPLATGSTRVDAWCE